MPVAGSKSIVAVGTTQVATGPATLVKVIVQTTLGAQLDVYDNTATTGTPILSIPSGTVAGTVYDVGVPCTLGIRVVFGVSGGATVVYVGG